MAVTAIFVAVIAASAQITFPLPSGVPVTLQTLAVAACGYCLGTKRSVSAVLTYLLMGLIGIPVFAGLKAGPAVLFSRTGGFIIGFVFLVFLCGIAAAIKRKWLKILLGIGGLILCHFVGVVWYAYLTQMNLWAAFLLVSLPFLVKDALCVAGAALLADKIVKVAHIPGAVS